MARILIVDDSAFTRNLIGRILEKGGHQIVGAACDGGEALQLFKQLKPELVTLDYLMPDVSGEVVLGEIMDLDPKARVIMISGSGDHTLGPRSMEKGARMYIEKPDVQRDILTAIDRVMQA